MANEITHNAVTGLTLYFCMFQQNGDVFLTGGASDEVWGTGGRDADDYDETMAEEASCGHYKGSVAAGVGAGVYQVVIYLQAGANPADSDVAIAQGEIYWNGSAEVNTYTMSETDIAAIVAKLPTNYIMGSSNVDDQDTTILDGTVPDNTSTENSIKLAADASGTNDVYNENLVILISGTGAGQARLIADYVGAVKTAAIRDKWLITPDDTTTYRIVPFSGILLSNTGLVSAATSDTITLNASAQAVADTYVGHTIFISAGTGFGQVRLITAYTAGRVATISPAWDVTPEAAASIYLILPVGRTYVNTISNEAAIDIREEIDTNSTRLKQILKKIVNRVFAG